jgi:hypothetical protein
MESQLFRPTTSSRGRHSTSGGTGSGSGSLLNSSWERPKSRSVTAADQLSTFFDHGWIETKSAVRTKYDDDKTYDIAYSFDGKTDNPERYSRLEVRNMPNQPTRPICMSGNAVIMLEKHTGLEVFNVNQDNTRTLTKVPLNANQQNVGMASDYSGHIPLHEEAWRQGKTVVMTEPLSFQKYHIQPPVFEISSKPECFEKAGSNCDKALLHPHERLIIQDFEKRSKSAGNMIAEAKNDRVRLKKQLTDARFHRGITGVDSHDNVNSEIYGERAKKQYADENCRTNLEAERRIHLSHKTSSMVTNGNILAPENLDNRVQVNKFLGQKGGDFHALPFQNTFNRLFQRTDAKKSIDNRTQALRERDLNGKTFNFITHAGIEHWPVSKSSKSEGPEHKVLAHPSQASLDHPRNLQGSIQRSNFII